MVAKGPDNPSLDFWEEDFEIGVGGALRSEREGKPIGKTFARASEAVRSERHEALNRINPSIVYVVSVVVLRHKSVGISQELFLCHPGIRGIRRGG